MDSTTQLRKLSQALSSGEEGQLYLAWCKDSGEVPTGDGARRFLDYLESGCKESTFILRKHRLGSHSALALAGLLDKVYLTKLDLSLNALRDHGCQTLVQLIRESPHLAYVNLGGNDISSVGASILATAIPLANALKTLILGCDSRHVYGNHIDSEGGRLIAEAVARSPALEVLDLSSNPLGAQHQGAFTALATSLTACKTLRSLKLGNTSMSASSAAAVVRACASSNVSALDLSDNGLPSSVCAVLAATLTTSPAAATGHPTATIIDGVTVTSPLSVVPAGRPETPRLTKSLPRGASANGSAPVGYATSAAGPAAGGSLPPLSPAVSAGGTQTSAGRPLTGSRFPFPPEAAAGGRAEPEVPRNTPLVDVNLSGNPRIGPKGAASLFGALAWAPAGSSLVRLALDRCALRAEGAAVAAHALATNQSLRELSLSGNDIDVDGGLAIAAALGQGISLLKLDLSNNLLGGTVASTIANELPRNPKLESIDLSDSRVDDDGAVALAVAVANPDTRISHVHLSGNYVSDDGGAVVAELIQQAPRLLTFDLARNHVSKRSLDLIAKVTERNRGAVTDAVPRRLEHELIKLHYAQVKLLDAKHALNHQVALRQDLVRKGERQESDLAAEKEEHSKRSKELVDRIVAEEELLKDGAAKARRRVEDKEKLAIKFEVDVQALGKQLAEETRKAADVAQQVEAAKRQLAEMESAHTRRLAELQQSVVLARQEKQQWRRMGADYYKSMIDVNKVISKLTEAVSLAETAAHERNAENLRKAKAKQAKENTEALAAFLAANS